MALQTCTLNLDRRAKELRPHGNLGFPCAGYSSHYTDRTEDIIPWHWHEEIEIIYMEYGQMTVRIPSKSFILEQGDCIALNSNMLHYAVAAPECHLHSLVFSPALITGNPDSVFAKRYMEPLLSCDSFTGYYIKAGGNDNRTAHWFHSAFEAIARDSFGYEFTVRENLSRICLFLYEEFQPAEDLRSVPANQDNLRIRSMMEYIHKHFSEDISLADIARKADISERECLRCFRKTIQLSPIQYLLKYRIMQGAEMLLRNPAWTISEVAALCGFDSPSNFAKLFKRFYNCAPREYRQREQCQTGYEKTGE